MKIAVASEKGETGKTTVAANLAFFLASTGQRVQYLDCDVENPTDISFSSPQRTRYGSRR